MDEYMRVVSGKGIKSSIPFFHLIRLVNQEFQQFLFDSFLDEFFSPFKIGRSTRGFGVLPVRLFLSVSA
jgi:hypothetical protein